MKAPLYSLSALMLLLSITSCGKKPSASDAAQTSETNPSTAENYRFPLQEVKSSITNNNLLALRKVLAANPGLDLNQILDNGETLLIMAIRLDHREIRNFLLDKQCSFEKASINQDTPLHVAVEKNRVNTVKVLLDRKVDIEKKNDAGDTPLLTAIKNNNDEITLILLKEGANINATNKAGIPAWQLSKKYNLPLSNEFVNTITQVEFGAPDVSTFRKVLANADVTNLVKILNRFPKLAEEYESINPLSIVVSVEDQFAGLKSAEILLENKANVNGPKNADETPLIKATVKQKEDFAKLFLSKAANPQLIDSHGKSALIHAIELNNPILVDLLLTYSALEKYSFRKDGKKITISACSVAKAVDKRLNSPAEKIANQQIKKSLDCGRFSWIF